MRLKRPADYTRQIAVCVLFTTSAAALAGAAGPVAAAYRGGTVASSWFERLRVPITFELLSLSHRNRLTLEAFERLPLAPGEIEVAPVSETDHVAVERIRFWSDRMREPRYLLVLEPKAPNQPEDALILNHGWFDRPEYLIEYAHLDRIYDDLLARGVVRPALVILPEVSFDSLRRLRSDPEPPYVHLVGDEIPELISGRYGIPLERDRWAIGGFSFGGYLSLDIARRYPERFSSLSVVSGFFDPKWRFWPDGPVPRLFLACGTNDWLFPTMRTLDRGLAGMGIEAEWSYAPGGHTWKYWSSVAESMLRFHLGDEGLGVRPD